MPEETITITISDKADIDWIRSRVRDGHFTSETEAVVEGISRLREDDGERELWIQEVVIPRYKRYKENPGQLISLAEAEKRLGERRKAHVSSHQ